MYIYKRWILVNLIFIFIEQNLQFLFVLKTIQKLNFHWGKFTIFIVLEENLQYLFAEENVVQLLSDTSAKSTKTVYYVLIGEPLWIKSFGGNRLNLTLSTWLFL